MMTWEAFSVFQHQGTAHVKKEWFSSGYKRINKSDASESKHAKLLSRVNQVDMKIITIIFLLFFYFKFNLSLDFFQKDLSQRFTSENSVVFPYCIELFCVRFSLRFQKLSYDIFYSRLNQERWNKCSVVELPTIPRKTGSG